MIKSIFKFIILKARLVLIIFALLGVIMGFYATKLGIDASSQTLLKDGDPDLKAWQDMSSHYALSDFLVVAFRPNGELLGDNSLKAIKQISDELASINGANGITSILSVPLLKSVDGGISALLKHTPTLNDKNVNRKKAAAELKNSPIYTNNLVSPDLKTTAILLNLKPNLTRKEEASLISNARAVLKNHQKDGELYLGGASMIASDMIEFIKRDLSVYSIALAGLLIVCLWLFFRSIRWVALPIFICTVSVVFTAGAFGMAGWQITAVSSNFIAIQLIITISIIIHLICTYKELAALRPSLSPKAITYLSLIKKANPSFWAIFTTIVGFASLCVSDIKPVMMLGVMMSLSVAISLIVAFVLFGAICSLLPVVSDKAKSRYFSSWLTQKTAKLALNNPALIFTLAIAAIIIGAYGISKLRAENSFISYFSPQTEIAKGMLIIDRDLGGTIPLDVVIKFNQKPKEASQNEFEDEFMEQNDDKYWFNAQKIRIAASVHEYLASNKFIGSVLSINTLIQAIKELEGKADGFILAAIQANMPATYKKILIDPYANIAQNELRFSVRIKDSNQELRRNEFIKTLNKDLANIVKNENVSISIMGAMVLYNNVLQSLVVSQIDTIGITVGTLFVLFVFIFRSAKIAAIAIIANLIPLMLVFGVMGILGIPLDVMSITIAAIAYGIGVDDIIHYTHRYLAERATHSSKEAILLASKGIGSAMFYTSVAVFAGFSMMMSSEFAPTVYFGGLICLVMVAMLLAALTLLPALLYRLSRA